MSRLKVLHVIPSVSPKRGGPSAALPLLLGASIAAGIDVAVATTDDDGAGSRREVTLERTTNGDDGATYRYFPRQLAFYTVSWPLRRWLHTHVRDFDVVHIHALFSFSSAVAARAARQAGVPYIVRPLGVLNRWGLENRRPLLKRASLRLIELPIIRHAAAMHYTSRREQREAEAVDPLVARTRAAIIPLPIESTDEVDPLAAERFHRRFPDTAARQVVLFLSRIDPKKGIELLMEAFVAVRDDFPNAMLAIAGEGDPTYVESLRARTQRLGIEAQVRWLGFMAGSEKAAAFAAATVFVLPSYSENFGIAAAEALAAGLPVLLSDQVAVADDVLEADAGVVVPCNASALADGLRRLLADDALRSAFAAKGRELARDRYSSATIGAQLKSLYESVMRQPRHDS